MNSLATMSAHYFAEASLAPPRILLASVAFVFRAALVRQQFSTEATGRIARGFAHPYLVARWSCRHVSLLMSDDKAFENGMSTTGARQVLGRKKDIAI